MFKAVSALVQHNTASTAHLQLSGDSETFECPTPSMFYMTQLLKYKSDGDFYQQSVLLWMSTEYAIQDQDRLFPDMVMGTRSGQCLSVRQPARLYCGKSEQTGRDSRKAMLSVQFHWPWFLLSQVQSLAVFDLFLLTPLQLFLISQFLQWKAFGFLLSKRPMLIQIAPSNSVLLYSQLERIFSKTCLHGRKRKHRDT